MATLPPLETADTGSVAVLLTAASQPAALALARSLVTSRTAACVQLLPGATSVYVWNGELKADSETVLLAKTRRSSLPALLELVSAEHEYDTPEVIALPIEAGSRKYLDWLRASTG
jgi:periplasmic divalent cation tolerance protein